MFPVGANISVWDDDPRAMDKRHSPITDRLPKVRATMP
jgi:hypothetical protein